MQSKNVEMKKAILKIMPEKTYNALIGMLADDIYNKVEYDVIILLARKCSNLYMGLLPLIREEQDGMIAEKHAECVKRQGREPVILTDRALDWVIWCIQKSAENKEAAAIRKILLVDDIIIHGRTLLRTKKKIQRAFVNVRIQDFQVDIAALAINNRKKLLIKESDIVNLASIKRCAVEDWHLFSGQIVDIIYLMGQTYTSYVPRICFGWDSEEGRSIERFIARENIQQITDRARKNLGVEIYAYVAEGREKYALCESYRIYRFSNQKKYVVVPMVSLNAVNDEFLQEAVELFLNSEILVCRESGGNAVLKEFLDRCSGVYKYRLLLYVISAMCGWRFLREQVGLDNADSYDPAVENLNFYLLGLKSFGQLREEGIAITDFLKRMETVWTDTAYTMAADDITTATGDEDVQHLTESLGKIIEMEKDTGTEIETVGKLLTVNNIMDECKYRESIENSEEDIQDRVRGIPLIDVVHILMERKHMKLAEVMRAILTEADYGRGSIVAHCFNPQSEGRWYTSLIHAGEENYRYYVRNYLPVLYGLCMLEFRGDGSLTEDRKKDYWQKFYEDNPRIKYMEDDRNYLVRTETLRELQNVVEDAALYQPLDVQEEKALGSAIRLVKEYAE